MPEHFKRWICFFIFFVSSTKKVKTVFSSVNPFLIIINSWKDSVYTSIELLT